jgi:hypothetical protein
VIKGSRHEKIIPARILNTSLPDLACFYDR